MGVVLCILMTVVGWLVECGSAHTHSTAYVRASVLRVRIGAHDYVTLRTQQFPKQVSETATLLVVRLLQHKTKSHL